MPLPFRLALVVALAACAVPDPVPEGRAPSAPPAPPASSRPSPPARESAPRLAVACLGDPAFLARARAIGAEECPVIYQQGAESEGRYDEAKLRETIRRNVRGGWSGLVLLDFEGRWLEFLKEDPASEAFQRGERALLRILEVAREERPEARYAFYGIPELRWYVSGPGGATVGWDKGTAEGKRRALERGARSGRIVAAADWVAPSIYDPYLTSVRAGLGPSQVEYARASTALAREMAAGRPVLPVVCHRTTPGGSDADGLALIPTDEFIAEQVRPALDAGASGVVWWGADRIWLRSGTLQRRQPKEFGGSVPRPQDELEAYVLRIHLERLEAIHDELSRRGAAH